MKPKKLIRNQIITYLKEGEWEQIDNIEELNELYALKVKEELIEIQASDYKDIMEFVDLIQVVHSFARVNGFSSEEIQKAILEKSINKGTFYNLALTNLNPENPSNKIYFENFENLKNLNNEI